MSTGIIITLIICGTIIALSIISAISDSNKRKNAEKLIDNIFEKEEI